MFPANSQPFVLACDTAAAAKRALRPTTLFMGLLNETDIGTELSTFTSPFLLLLSNIG